MGRILTIDLGTTLFKFAAFDECGQMLASSRAAPPVTSPQPGWAELRAGDFEATVLAGIAQLRQQAGSLDDVDAVSFATQANSFTLLDTQDRPLTPLILWTDARAAAFEPSLRRISSDPDVARISGVPQLNHLFAAAKLVWLRRNRPADFAAAHRLCFISDYLTLLFSGQHFTEGAVAGLSGGCDIRLLTWSDPLCAAIGLERNLLGSITRAGTDVGTIGSEIAGKAGLPRRCRFVIGCLDQYAGAVGTGCVVPNELAETTGTVLAAVRCADLSAPWAQPGIFSGPSFDPGLRFDMSFSSTSANLLEWYRNGLSGRPSFEELSRLAAAEPPGAGGIVIEPYQDGEPIERCFRHVNSSHSPGQVVRAIMEAVARELKRQVQALSADHAPAQIRAAGGGARSDTWLQIKADVLGVPFAAPAVAEPTSLGAAMLAARAVHRMSIVELAKRWVKIRNTFYPRG